MHFQYSSYICSIYSRKQMLSTRRNFTAFGARDLIQSYISTLYQLAMIAWSRHHHRWFEGWPKTHARGSILFIMDTTFCICFLEICISLIVITWFYVWNFNQNGLIWNALSGYKANIILFCIEKYKNILITIKKILIDFFFICW